MIPEAAVKAFLEKPRADYRWIKELSSADLDEALAGIQPSPDLYPKLRLHQKACILLGLANPAFGFWVDMGGGKTLIALELARYWYKVRKARRIVILVTSDKAYLTWEKQIKLYGINVPYVFLDGSSEHKWEQLANFGTGIVVVHYPGLRAMVTQRVAGQDVIRDGWLSNFCSKVDCLILDESTKVGNPRSLIHRIAQELAWSASYRYALAGRPFGRDPQLLWPQFDLIDRGETLGETLGLFREAFFSSARNYAARGKRSKYVRDFKFDKRKMPQLTRIIQNKSITYHDGEFPDMPPLARTPMVEEVKLPGDAALYYQRLIDQVIAAKGNLSEMKNVFLRMRQLSSGYLAMRDDATGDRVELEFDTNPKLELLEELIDELPEGRKAVIFYEFTHSGRIITKLLEKKGLNPVWIWSGTKKPTQDLKRFMDDPDCAGAVINHKVGAYSLDGLQVANYVFFYESPVSVLDRTQAEKRVWRQGQARHVYQYDLVVRDTVDQKILDFHKEGRDLYKELIREPEIFFGRKRKVPLTLVK